LKNSSGFSLGDFFTGTKDPNSLGFEIPFCPPKEIPFFTLSVSSADVLKPDAVLVMCQIYQQHMKKIAAGITHDQVRWSKD